MANDRDALQELFRASRPGVPHVILHYIYLPSEKAAATVASELREQGFQTENQVSAEGVNWLVLAQHQVVPTEQLLANTRQLMEILSARLGGEYDGWEAEVLSTD